MGRQSTLRSLIRINLVITGVVCSTSFIFLLIANLDLTRIVSACGMGALIVFSIGMADIQILGFKLAPGVYDALSKRQKGLRYLLSYLASPLIYIFVWFFFEPLRDDAHSLWRKPVAFTALVVLSSWLMNTLIVILYNFEYLRVSKVQSEFENLKLKAILSETANEVLKQQIHPHFLFNVLTTIKTLYKQDIKQGESYLVHLANFLRASLSNPTARIVKLEDELQLCFDYIEMQRIRFGAALTYQHDLPPALLQQKCVPYFAIQALLENAIKHNELTEEAPLHIKIVQAGDFLKIINNLQARHFKEPSTGQGLINLAERYKLLTGADIRIAQSENEFAVSIKLLDHDDHHH